MGKRFVRNRTKKLRSAIVAAILISCALVYVDLSTLFAKLNSSVQSMADGCYGRYIYIQDIPSRFNQDLIKNCSFLSRGVEKPTADKVNICQDLMNFGLGAKLENVEDGLSNNGWFATNQFLTDVIFHNRMKMYECLTNDPSMASAIYVPYYASLDLSRFLWSSNITWRDSSGKDLLRWLASRPEWKKMWGRDHFLVSGRTSWDVRRSCDSESCWGSKFRFLPESKNMSMLSVEASQWNNDHAIPYPTHFHPSTHNEVLQWQNKVRTQKRPHLFSFIGAPRPKDTKSIRSKIIEECRSSTKCRFLDCSPTETTTNICDDPKRVMEVFQNSVFCLQPPGDSYTRRSIFDSIVAGCIPVFFNPSSAYSQYTWHLPKNGAKYSVYIPIRDATYWFVSLELMLQSVADDRVVSLREEVIKLIPNVVYAHPRVKWFNSNDAFALAVKGILETIEEVSRNMKQGRDPSVGFDDENPSRFSG